jgi:hypothetical protein
MNRSRKIWLAALYAISFPAAILLWVVLYGRGAVFHFAGIYITPGIFALSALILVDGLIFLLLSR